jgi:hypothetical protein
MNARVLLLLAAAAPAFAQFTPISTPTGSYTGSTTSIPVVGANFSTLTSLSSGAQTVTFSSTLDVRTVPGGGWATWASPPNTESATPRVVAALGAPTLTLILAQPASTFGFEIEPNDTGVFTITATFRNGGSTLGTITQGIQGNAGARLIAASSTTPITSVVISAPSGGGFALAQIRFGSPTVNTVPALGPSGTAGLGMLLAAAGALLARKQQLV